MTVSRRRHHDGLLHRSQPMLLIARIGVGWPSRRAGLGGICDRAVDEQALARSERSRPRRCLGRAFYLWAAIQVTVQWPTRQ